MEKIYATRIMRNGATNFQIYNFTHDNKGVASYVADSGREVITGWQTVTVKPTIFSCKKILIEFLVAGVLLPKAKNGVIILGYSQKFARYLIGLDGKGNTEVVFPLKQGENLTLKLDLQKELQVGLKGSFSFSD